MTEAPDASHAGELLSALVDGELTAAEAERVLGHVDDCARCSEELDVLERSRSALRALPELEPPPDLIEGLVRRRHRRVVLGALGGFAAAAVAVLVALSASVGPVPRIEPQLAAFVDDHEATAVTVPAAPDRQERSSFAGLQVDNRVAGFDLVAVQTDDEVVHAFYWRDGRVVSVFRQDGAVDWDALPEGGERLRVGDRDAWRSADDSSMVLDVDGSVVTIVGADREVRAQVAGDVSGPPPESWWDRAHDAAQTVLGAFDFG